MCNIKELFLQRIVFPMNALFVFGDFFLVDNFVVPCLIFSTFCKVSGVAKMWGFWLSPGSGGGRRTARKRLRPELLRSGSQNSHFFPTPLTSQKRCKMLNQLGQIKLLTRDIKMFHQ